MKRKRFSEEQIIRILKEAEAIGNIREACRQNNVTEQTFYRWRNKFGGMEVSDAKRLRSLEKENSEQASQKIQMANKHKRICTRLLKIIRAIEHCKV